MNGPSTKIKAYRDDTNDSICINKSAPPKTMKNGPMKPILIHEITNNSLIQKILYQKQSTKPSARLRRNTPNHGFNKTHDQRSLTAPTKLTLCRQTKRQNPWTLIGHNGGSAQGQHMCANQITTARRHVDTTKLPLSTET
jgi:hypothetical protein